MAKRKNLRKSAEQYDIEETYMKIRKKLQANVRSLVKRGYHVAEDYIPSIPKRITEGSIRKLEQLNKERYKKSTKTVYDYDEHDFIELSGNRARVRDIRQSTMKAELTKRAHKKGYESYDQYRNSDEYYRLKRETADYDRGYYHDLVNDTELYEDLVSSGYEPRDAYNIVNKQSSDEELQGKFIDIDTGEVINQLRPENIRVMPTDSFSEAIYNNLMGELDRLIEYEGTDKHAKDTRVNAQQIKNYIKQMENSKRKEVLLALNQMFDEGQLLSPQMYYRTGGYNDFIYKLGQAIDYVEVVQAYGEDADYGAYSTYEDAED